MSYGGGLDDGVVAPIGNEAVRRAHDCLPRPMRSVRAAKAREAAASNVIGRVVEQLLDAVVVHDDFVGHRIDEQAGGGEVDVGDEPQPVRRQAW